MEHSDQTSLNPNDILIKETAGIDIGALKYLTLHPSILPPILRSYMKDQNETIFNSDNLFTNYLQSHFCEVETPLPNQEAIKELDRCVRSNNYLGRLSYFEGSNYPGTTLDLPVQEFLNTRKKHINSVGFVRQHAVLQGVDFDVHNLLKVFQPKKIDKKKLLEKLVKRKYTKKKKPDPNNPDSNRGLEQGNLKPEELEELERKRREKEERQLYSKEPIRRTPHSHKVPDLEVVRKRVFPKEDKQRFFHKPKEQIACENCGIVPTEVKPGNLCKRCFRQKERRENILFQVERKEETAYRADRAERVERAKQRRTAQVVEEEEDEDEEESEWEDLLNPSEIKETRVGATYQAEIPSFSVARPNTVIKEKKKDWGPDLLESKSFTLEGMQEQFRKRALESYRKIDTGRRDSQEIPIEKLKKDVDILIDQEITAKKLNDHGLDMDKFLNWLRNEAKDFDAFLSEHKSQKQSLMRQFFVQKQLGK